MQGHHRIGQVRVRGTQAGIGQDGRFFLVERGDTPSLCRALDRALRHADESAQLRLREVQGHLDVHHQGRRSRRTWGMGLVVSPDAGKRRGIEWKAAAGEGADVRLRCGRMERQGARRCRSMRREPATGRRQWSPEARGGSDGRRREVSLDARGWGDRRGGGASWMRGDAAAGAPEASPECGAMGRQERGMGRQARARCRSAGRKRAT